MVEVGTGGRGSRFISKDWPIEDGLIAGTTTQEGHQEHLIAEEEDLSPEYKGVNPK